MTKSKDKILIFGNGQIGNFYLDYFKTTDHEVSLSKIDVTNYEDVEKAVKDYAPTVVINAVGKTNLEWILKNKLEAINVNTLAANNLAEVCANEGVYYIFLSSGCIFESKDENDIKAEDAEPSPASFYSWTKVWAEEMLPWKKKEGFEYLILRPRQPVSSQISEKNMLIKLLTFTKYIDTPNAGTVLEDLMPWTQTLMEGRVTGVVNVANQSWSTPYRIGLLLKKHVLPELNVEIFSKAALDARTPEKRVDTVLDVSKLVGIVGEENVKPYEERLEEIIIDLGNNFREADKEFVKEIMEKTVEATKQRATPNDVWPSLCDL